MRVRSSSLNVKPSTRPFSPRYKVLAFKLLAYILLYKCLDSQTHTELLTRSESYKKNVHFLATVRHMLYVENQENEAKINLSFTTLHPSPSPSPSPCPHQTSSNPPTSRPPTPWNSSSPNPPSTPYPAPFRAWRSENRGRKYTFSGRRDGLCKGDHRRIRIVKRSG